MSKIGLKQLGRSGGYHQTNTPTQITPVDNQGNRQNTAGRGKHPQQCGDSLRTKGLQNQGNQIMPYDWTTKDSGLFNRLLSLRSRLCPIPFRFLLLRPVQWIRKRKSQELARQNLHSVFHNHQVFICLLKESVKISIEVNTSPAAKHVWGMAAHW